MTERYHHTHKSASHQKKWRSTAYKDAVRGKQSSPRLLLMAAFESFHTRTSFSKSKTQPTRHFTHNVSRREHVKVFPGPADEVESFVLSRQAVKTNTRAALTYCLTKVGKAIAAEETNLNKTSCRFTLRCQTMPHTLHHTL